MKIVPLAPDAEFNAAQLAILTEMAKKIDSAPDPTFELVRVDGTDLYIVAQAECAKVVVYVDKQTNQVTCGEVDYWDDMQ